MAHYEVTQEELNAAIQELTNQNAEFKSSVSKLVAAKDELCGMWQGDANNTFKAAFEADQGKWTEFAATVEKYIEGLTKIMNLYSNAESRNVETASKRTY